MPDDDCFTCGSLVELAAQLPNEMTRVRSKDQDETFGSASVSFKPQEDDRVDHIGMSLE
jgi:hypothetical protein